MRCTHPRAAVVAALAALFASGPTLADTSKPVYQAEVARTSYGIPHIKATDWGSLGYGYGYAFAQDNVCVLAREVLAASGTQSRYFGASTVASDRVYQMANSAARVEAAWNAVDAETRSLLTGYADGYNRYLRDTGPGALPADCRNQPWVQPITGRDALKVLRKLLVRAGTGNFIAGLNAAVPPVAVGSAAATDAGVSLAQADAAPSASDVLAAIDPAELPDFNVEHFGSNAVGLGGDLTGGAGALLGNPHFPWQGIERFYAVHLTIPGRYDAMGASIFGFPLVNIGFNRDVAWSHTVSTARRFVLRELTLVAGNPTAYLVDGAVVPMTQETVSVDVRQADGSVATTTHTFWMTRYGPVVVPAAAAAWTTARAFALTDINLENGRAFRQYREMGMARNLDEFAGVLRRHVGLPWVNTIAVDRAGNAFYGDIGSMPNASAARLAACVASPVSAALNSLRLYTLDGSRSSCDLGTDADAPEPGIFGAGSMPGLMRRDFVQNSNDSYWLANPAQPLVGFSPVIGVDENRPQGFRTRLGITQIEQRKAGADGLSGAGFSRQWLQDVLYGNRHYSAEIMLDGVLQLCGSQSNSVLVGGQPVNVAPACAVLAGWDRRNQVNSVGAHVWTELWRRLAGVAGVYAVPFDPADPVNTPRGLATTNPTIAARVMAELGATVQFFAANGIPLDRPWGQVQFETRNGERIPIHGGSGVSGVYNAISPATIVPGVGYAQIVTGSSFIQSVTFTPSGPEARALLTYSQSSDPASPHFADMTKLYAAYGWVNLPFAEGDIRRDPNLSVIRLSEKR